MTAELCVELRRSFMLRAVQVDVARRVLIWMLSSWYIGPFVLDLAGWTDIVSILGYSYDMTLVADLVVSRPLKWIWSSNKLLGRESIWYVVQHHA